MGQYNKAILTAAAENLIARTLAGEIQLNISKAKTSNYIYPEGTDFKSLKDMQGIKQTANDPATAVYSDTTIQSRVLFSNEEIASTYYIHNIGLYAMDGTEEVLFCIVTAETPDEMPQYNGVASTSYIYNIQNVVQDAAKLNITVNSSGTATIQDVMEKVDATGGDISETVIETLDTIEDKYPVPAAGENVKRFFGKVLTFLRNIRPLTGDITLYVSVNTGSDITGDGSESSPYASITKVLSAIPKDLGGHTATICISDGTYNESVDIQNFIGGVITICLDGDVTVHDLQIINSYVTCTTSGSVNTLTLSWIYLTAKANIYSSDVNFQVHTTGSFASSDTPSIFINDGSDFYIPGLTTLGTHIGVAVVVQHHAIAYFGSVQGSGFDVGFGVYLSGRCTCVYNNLNATRPVVATSGGIFTKSSGAVVGSLQSNVTYYVANTGSDLTGNGTSGNPFKTIQHAIDIIPKDLNGYAATINVAAGTYDEDIQILSFRGGALNLYSDTKDTFADTCKIKSMDIKYNSSYVLVNGITLTTTTKDAVTIWGSLNVRMFWCQSTVTSNYRGMYFGESGGRVLYCKFANKNTVLSSVNSTIYSGGWDSGSTGNTIGLQSFSGSILLLAGTQPTATTLRTQSDSGQYFYDNGTQITGLFTSGLSCTWGTISGGYRRVGNINGIAQIIVSLRILVTSPLTANVDYTVGGFPIPADTDAQVSACSCNRASETKECYLVNSALHFIPNTSETTGLALHFNCTYITNS